MEPPDRPEGTQAPHATLFSIWPESLAAPLFVFALLAR